MNLNRIGLALAAGAVALWGCATAAGSGDSGLKAALSGAAEVPGPADPDGSGSASIRFADGAENLCYEIKVSDIAPATMAHIHTGAAGEGGGPPVVALGAPTQGASSGCVAASPAIVDKIRADPAGYFVNIHNSEFPGGAVRGQLRR